jgi:hypothetical protein
MSTPAPGTPEYNKHLRDQNEQFETDEIGAAESWQPGENYVSTASKGTAQTPSKFPTGEDTELNTEDE